MYTISTIPWNITTERSDFAFFECANQISVPMAIGLSSTALGAASLSLFGSSFVLISYLHFSETGGSWTQFFHTNPDDGITSLIALLTLCHYSLSVHTFTSFVPMLYWLLRNDPIPNLAGLCEFRSGWFQVSTGASVLWTAFIAVYLYVLVFHRARVLLHTGKIWVLFNFVSWGLPLLLFLLSFALKGIKQSPLGICTPQEPYLLALWFAPNCLFFVCTMAVYISIHIRLRCDITYDIQSNSGREIPFKYRITLYLIVYVLCWVVDISTYVYSKWNCAPYGMVILAVFLFLLRGFLDALVYTQTNRKLKSFYQGVSCSKLCLWILFSPIVLIPNLLLFLLRKFKQIPWLDGNDPERDSEDEESSASYTEQYTRPPYGEGSSLLFNGMAN
jgi:hypothetical protein